MVTKTQEEWDGMTPEQRKAHLVEEEKTVFGHDVKRVKGRPVEKGVGSTGHESENHFRAIEKNEGKEAADKARAEAAARRKKAA